MPETFKIQLEVTLGEEGEPTPRALVRNTSGKVVKRFSPEGADEAQDWLSLCSTLLSRAAAYVDRVERAREEALIAQKQFTPSVPVRTQIYRWLGARKSALKRAAVVGIMASSAAGLGFSGIVSTEMIGSVPSAISDWEKSREESQRRKTIKRVYIHMHAFEVIEGSPQTEVMFSRRYGKVWDKRQGIAVSGKYDVEIRDGQPWVVLLGKDGTERLSGPLYIVNKENMYWTVQLPGWERPRRMRMHLTDPYYTG